MVTSLIALASLMSSVVEPQTVTLVPTDDVWVYPHASDPSGDSALRVWGIGTPAPKDLTEAGEFSMSYLKWALTGIPSDKKLVKATLILRSAAASGPSEAQMKAAPIQVRGIEPSFAEKGWEYEKGVAALLPKPGKESVLGEGIVVGFDKEKYPTVTIDLLKGPADFKKLFSTSYASPKRELGLALTSALNMGELGRAGVYKVFSREAMDPTLRPQLILLFE